MRIAILIGGTAALALAAWMFWPGAAISEAPPPSAPIAARQVEFEGVASCAAAACHGNGKMDSPGGEWNTWAHLDPHARAYDTLLEQPARDIERRLNPSAEPRPERNELCLNCHVQPGILQANRSPRFALADGVGCESCHGPAATWLTSHTLPNAPRPSGMTDTRGLHGRATVCTTCHVGAGDVQVNHDLIAAGHPRLRFEFASYLANLPAHWSKEADRRRHPDLEARAWLVGQGVSTEAALRLLVHRANARPGLWPELAEYDCYACHHDLAVPSWRITSLPAGTTPGQLQLNGWYYANLPTLAKDIDLQPLQAVLGSSFPQRTRVATLAAKPLQQLSKLQASLATRPLNSPARLGLLAELAALPEPARPSWDRDTQRYLAAAALTAGPDVPPDVRATVARLRSLLHEAFQTGTTDTLASPRGYTPDAVRRAWQELSMQLAPRP